MFFSLASNILVVSSILIGGAAAINSLTGMSVYASLWLLPMSVTAYTLRGGLRATILTDYVSALTSLLFALQYRHGFAGTHRHHLDHHLRLLVQGLCYRRSNRLTSEDVGVAT